MLVVSIIAATLVSTEQGWFNGNQGLFGIPQPFAASLGLSITGYDWFFVGLTAAIAAGAWFLTARFTGSPWGRRLRAMRENAEADRVPRHQYPQGIAEGVRHRRGARRGERRPARGVHRRMVTGGVGHRRDVHLLRRDHRRRAREQLRRAVRRLPRPRGVPRAADLPAADVQRQHRGVAAVRVHRRADPGVPLVAAAGHLPRAQAQALRRCCPRPTARSAVVSAAAAARDRAVDKGVAAVLAEEHAPAPDRNRSPPRCPSATCGSASAACKRWTGSPSTWFPARPPA